MTLADQECQNGIIRGRSEHGIDVSEFRIEYLMRCGIEERPRHEESEDENETAVGAGLDRDPRPFVALEKFGILFVLRPNM
jgi:hypothetical protein